MEIFLPNTDHTAIFFVSACVVGEQELHGRGYRSYNIAFSCLEVSNNFCKIFLQYFL